MHILAYILYNVSLIFNIRSYIYAHANIHMLLFILWLKHNKIQQAI